MTAKPGSADCRLLEELPSIRAHQGCSTVKSGNCGLYYRACDRGLSGLERDSRPSVRFSYPNNMVQEWAKPKRSVTRVLVTIRI